MKLATALVLAAALLATSGGLAAQELRAAEDTGYRTTASGWIGVGTFLEVLGYGGATVGIVMIAAGRNEGGFALTTISGGVVTAGAFTSTISHSVRHGAYRKAGFQPRPLNAGLGWAFTSLSAVACTVSVVSYFKLTDQNTGWGPAAGYALLWLATTAVTVVMDIVNLSLIRFRWRRDMKQQEQEGRPWVALAPMVNAAGLAVVGGF